jgi:hypothetical protein
MTTDKELRELIETCTAMGATITNAAGTIRIAGLKNCGKLPMPPIQAAERMRELISTRIGAGILGFFAGVRCCDQAGLDADQVYCLVRNHVRQNT